MKRTIRNWLLFSWFVAVVAGGGDLRAQGIMLSSTGTVNRSMGGAAVAAPLEAIGALRWNPATIEAVPSQVGFTLELVFPHLELESSVPGLGSGSTNADPGVTPIPAVGWVHHVEDTPFTIGFGVYAVAGFRTNYPASLTNPILAPQSDNPAIPGGMGRIYSEAQFVQIAPTFAMALTEQLSIGVSPRATIGSLVVDPFMAGPPDDANGSGAPTYPSGRGTHAVWGGGVQLGIFYILNDQWRFGAAITSPDWMQSFKFNTENELGVPQTREFDLDLPMIASLGASWAARDNLLIAVDARYFDYENTAGFREHGYTPEGAVRGLGWRSVFATAVGTQYRAADWLYLRAGYTYNENPIPGSQTTANIASPLYYQHELNTGASLALAENVWVNLAYSYWPTAEISGPLVTPTGPIPGASVTQRESNQFGSLGLTVNY